MRRRLHLEERLGRAQRHYTGHGNDELNFRIRQASDLDYDLNTELDDGQYHVQQRGNTRYKASRWQDTDAKASRSPTEPRDRLYSCRRRRHQAPFDLGHEVWGGIGLPTEELRSETSAVGRFSTR